MINQIHLTNEHNLDLEDQLVLDILALLDKASLWRRRAILDTVYDFLECEEEVADQNMKNTLIEKLTAFGCDVRSA